MAQYQSRRSRRQPDEGPRVAPHRRVVRRFAACGVAVNSRRRDESGQLGRQAELLRRLRLRQPGRELHAVPLQRPPGRDRRPARLARVGATDGSGKRQAVQIVAESVQFLGSRGDGERRRRQPVRARGRGAAGERRLPGHGRRRHPLLGEAWPERRISSSSGGGPAARRGRSSAATASSARNTIAEVDYKNVTQLRRYVSEKGKIRSRRITGACRRHQVQVATAVKRAREMALLPYVAEGADDRERRPAGGAIAVTAATGETADGGHPPLGRRPRRPPRRRRLGRARLRPQLPPPAAARRGGDAGARRGAAEARRPSAPATRRRRPTRHRRSPQTLRARCSASRSRPARPARSSARSRRPTSPTRSGARRRSASTAARSRPIRSSASAATRSRSACSRTSASRSRPRSSPRAASCRPTRSSRSWRRPSAPSRRRRPPRSHRRARGDSRRGGRRRGGRGRSRRSRGHGVRRASGGRSRGRGGGGARVAGRRRRRARRGVISRAKSCALRPRARPSCLVCGSSRDVHTLSTAVWIAQEVPAPSGSSVHRSPSGAPARMVDSPANGQKRPVHNGHTHT